MNTKTLSEILRYLGYKNKMEDLDPEIKEEVENCFELAEKNSKKDYAVKYFDFKIEGNKVIIEDAHIVFESKDLVKLLEKSEKLALACTTLGMQFDKLCKRTSLTDMSKNVILNSCGSTLVERHCDEIQIAILNEINNSDKLKKIEDSSNYMLTWRYSPGYGDLSLDSQKDIIRVLDAYKKLGLTLTDANLMVPEKSVTFIVGLTKEKSDDKYDPCESCLIQCSRKGDGICKM